MKRPIAILAATVVCIGLLAACADRSDVETKLTIDVAKSDTQGVESRIITRLPADMVASVEQQDQGVLLACDADSVNWAGGAIVTVQGSPDFATVLSEVKSEFDSDEKYRATLTTDSFDEPLLEVESAAGARWLVGPMSDGTVLDISSFSPCFTTPEGMQPSDSY